MKKFLSAFLIIGFGIYVATQRPSLNALPVAEPVATVATTTVSQAVVEPPAPKPSPKPPVPAPIVAVPPKPRGVYVDGVYTGAVADAYYGNMQVQVIITGQRIADVQFLQYPNDRRTSIAINSQAMPYLKQEAIAAQSAKVNGVSGATASSRAFVESLASALAKAKA